MATGAIKNIIYKKITFSASGNVAANGTATLYLNGTVPSGYTPIGIIKFDTGNTYITAEHVSTSAMRVHNNTTSSKAVTAEVVVICAPSDLVL